MKAITAEVHDITHQFCAKVILYFCTAVISIFFPARRPIFFQTKTDSGDPRQSGGLHCKILSAKSGKITKDNQDGKINLDARAAKNGRQFTECLIEISEITGLSIYPYKTKAIKK